MRRPIAAFVVATLFTVFAAPVSQAAPTQVHVRIEGKTETLFEGPILTDVHRVKDSSDSQWRRCNGVTALNPLQVPAVVPTSASSDAMRIIGESFDGLWYSQWEDYFIERWGPDAQEVGSFKYWGVLVNNVFTVIGGCQYALDGGDEVLWTFDAFNDRPRLVLYPASYPGGALPSTVTATLNQPFEVEVDTWTSSNEGNPPASPTRSTTPYLGAEVAPVTTGAKGFQQMDLADATDPTGANGRTSITFTQPGWHRIKATDVVSGAEVAVRSNRLDVCVPEPPASSCGTPPADTTVRTPPPPLPGELEEKGAGGKVDEPKDDQPSGDGGSQGGSGGQAPPVSAPPAEAGQVQVQLSRLDRSRITDGLVKVSWRVLDQGAGIAKWTIASKTLGRKGARWVSRASGDDRTSASVRLPPGATYKLRLTIIDSAGRSSSALIGKVQVPR